MTSNVTLQNIIDAFPSEVMIVDENAIVLLVSRTMGSNPWCNQIVGQSFLDYIDVEKSGDIKESIIQYFQAKGDHPEDRYFKVVLTTSVIHSSINANDKNLQSIVSYPNNFSYSLVINPTDKVDDSDLSCYSVTFMKTGDGNIITTPSSYLRSQYLEMIYENTSDAIFLAPFSIEKGHGNFIEVNSEACKRLGYTRDELLQLNARILNPAANFNRIASYGEMLIKDKFAAFEAIHLAKNGEHIPVSVHATLVSEGRQSYVLSVVRDLRVSKKYESAQALFGRLMEYSWNEIYVIDSETLSIKMANEGALKNLGIEKTKLTEYKFSDLLEKTSVNDFISFAQGLFDGSETQLVYESKLRRLNGSTYPVEIRLQLSQSEVPPLFFANVQDISERKKTERRLTYLASYDALTGLPNKALYMDRLGVAIEAVKRQNMLIAVMFIDLDGFKQVNDTHGHEIGDLLVREVAKRLLKSIRKSDTVARFGGDEFTIILNNIGMVDGVNIVIDKIMKNITEPFMLDGKEVLTSPSIGVTLYPYNDEDDANELLRQADIAMYYAKEMGKCTSVYYSSALSEKEARRSSVEASVRNALKRKELELFFQPRVSLIDGAIVGAEVLLRWQKSSLGFVSPVEFIPLMEKTGVIIDVGEWVLRESCIQLREWMDLGFDFRISVNVSARQFEGCSLHELVSQVLKETNVPADRLEIEITEGLLIDQSEDAITSLEKMSETGVSISLDDFGTGYSSLSYLKQFPIDILKIDRSFVMDLKENKDSLVIVEAIIGLAKNLGLSVTAEGIEEEWHANFLKDNNCDEGQGYYFARPMPKEEMLKALEESKTHGLPLIKNNVN